MIGGAADTVAQEIRDHLGSAPVTFAQPAEAPSVSLDEATTLALGGASNIRTAARKAGRICVVLVRPDAMDAAALEAASPKGFVRTGTDGVQILA